MGPSAIRDLLGCSRLAGRPERMRQSCGWLRGTVQPPTLLPFDPPARAFSGTPGPVERSYQNGIALRHGPLATREGVARHLRLPASPCPVVTSRPDAQGGRTLPPIQLPPGVSSSSRGTECRRTTDPSKSWKRFRTGRGDAFFAAGSARSRARSCRGRRTGGVTATRAPRTGCAVSFSITGHRGRDGAELSQPERRLRLQEGNPVRLPEERIELLSMLVGSQGPVTLAPGASSLDATAPQAHANSAGNPHPQ